MKILKCTSSKNLFSFFLGGPKALTILSHPVTTFNVPHLERFAFFKPSCVMSKRVNLSNENPPAKRARRFRLARSNPLPTVPTSTSLFVTVNADDEGRGKLKSQSRLLSSNVDSSAQSSSTTPATVNEQQNDETLDFPDLMEDMDPTPQPDIPPKTKRKRNTTNVVSRGLHFNCKFYSYVPQDHLKEWLKFRTIFLQETIRHDGLGNFSGVTHCSKCGKGEGIYKCNDCACAEGVMLKCADCIVELHRALPLHRVEVSKQSL